MTIPTLLKRCKGYNCSTYAQREFVTLGSCQAEACSSPRRRLQTAFEHLVEQLQKNHITSDKRRKYCTTQNINEKL